ncbi:PcfJ domain-containing protein [uncultured Microscilla sp.]|uniref:PcfJ domain-containing protein n=1 Tax=uncultured Microscilla sp. TaxID=432653 RepID=UPI002636D315|nr:PcfJ domain-containing protein [uncultured Microscilla sp.]
MSSRLKKADLTKPRKTLEALFRKKLKPENLEENSPYKPIGQLIRGDWQGTHHEKKAFYHFLDSIARRKGYEIYREAEALLAVFGQANQWLRLPKGWMPTQTEDAQMVFSDLVHYLFAQYEVPQFMDNAWHKGNMAHIDWFIHLGKGQNIRTAPNMYAHLTKKMAHHFLQAPADYTIEEALTYGQVTALGGDDLLIKQLLNSPLLYISQDQGFWLSLLQFFLNNKELAQDNHIKNIVEFINIKRMTNVAVDDYGQLTGKVGRPYSLKQKTAASMMREVRAWQQKMANSYSSSYDQLTTWAPVKVNNFLKKGNGITYRIMQLTNNFALLREGEKMRHCVGNYMHRCQTGDVSIWALTATSGFSVKPLLTIELKQNNTITQVRGKVNRMPDLEEAKLIKQWAAREQLKVGHHCEISD